MTLSENSIFYYDLFDSSEPKLISSTKLEAKGQPKFTNCKWNTHHNNSQVATCNDTAIRGWDLKSMKFSTIKLKNLINYKFLLKAVFCY